MTNYIIDVNTTNKSFIRMYKILKNKGIKHNKFFLILYDKDLVGVNPFDEANLTRELQIKINAEVIRNPWYFLREIVRIPVPGGLKRYELHLGNLAQSFCMFNSLNLIELLPRQHGKTVGTCCVYEWFYDFNSSNSNILFLNKEFVDSKRNLKILKDIRDNLPSYLKFNNNKLDTNNIEYMSSSKNGNTIRALSAAHSEDEADKKGRGNTSPLMWWDEFAFLKYNDIMYLAAAPACSQATLEARANRKNYGKVITTTPNNIDSKEGAFCKKLIDDAAVFIEDFYDWSKDKIEEYIKNNSKNDFVYIEYSYTELGRDEAWFEKQQRSLNNDRSKIKRELLLEWTRSSETSIFDEEQLDKLFSLIKKPIGDLTLLNYYKIYFYKNIDFNKTWIIGVDPSNATEQDATAITIFDPFTFEIVGEFRNNKIDTDTIKFLIYDLVSKYLRNSILAIENNIGKHILDYLMKTSIEKNIYYEYKEVMAQKIEESMTELVYTKNKKKTKVYGVNTNKYSRPKMIEILFDVVNNDIDKIATKYFYSDCKDMERDKHGKIQHRDGGHDDSVFSYLVGRYMLSDGTNLAKFRINPSSKETDPEKRQATVLAANKFISYANQDKLNTYKDYMEDMLAKDLDEFNQQKKNLHKNNFYNGLITDEKEKNKVKLSDIWL